MWFASSASLRAAPRWARAAARAARAAGRRARAAERLRRTRRSRRVGRRERRHGREIRRKRWGAGGSGGASGGAGIAGTTGSGGVQGTGGRGGTSAGGAGGSGNGGSTGGGGDAGTAGCGPWRRRQPGHGRQHHDDGKRRHDRERCFGRLGRTRYRRQRHHGSRWHGWFRQRRFADGRRRRGWLRRAMWVRDPAADIPASRLRRYSSPSRLCCCAPGSARVAERRGTNAPHLLTRTPHLLTPGKKFLEYLRYLAVAAATRPTGSIGSAPGINVTARTTPRRTNASI